MAKTLAKARQNPAVLIGVVDDGTREVPLVNKFGKTICKIYFRPADLSLFDRYKAFMKDFEKVVEPLKNVSINSDGTASIDSEFEVLKEVERNLKNRLNVMFDMDEADEIFAKRNPFSSVGGEFFCTRVISAMGSVIEQAIREEAQLSQARIEKYLPDMEGENAGATSENANGM